VSDPRLTDVPAALSDPRLADLLADRAEALDEVIVRPADGTWEVTARGTLVAVIAPGTLEVHLRPSVAAAALRTPDVEASPRGRGWVRFAPAQADEFARDRAFAWLESAVRLATEGDPG